MCEIAGIYKKHSTGKNILEKEINKMLKKIQHRCPDDNGINFVNEQICIGNVRTSIVDINKGHQPISINKNLSITFNGEIYNYQDLKYKYFSRYKFSTNSDTEVILNGYHKFGLNVFSQLNGMFAVCIVDKNKFILARDRIGIKSLYYKITLDQFIFASELKALVDNNEKWFIHNDNKLFETLPGNKTIYSNIYEVPPGSFLIYDGYKIEIQNYWDLKKISYNTTNKTQNECIDELRYLIHDAINIRKPTMPFGVSISGGLDSAIIACISKPDYLFSSITKISNLNEEKYCDYLGKYLKTPIIKTYPSKNNFIETLPELIKCMDTPTTTLAIFPIYILAKKAKEYVKVLMTGQGADELFGGYIRYVLIYIEYIKKYAPELNSYKNLARHFWNEKYDESLDKKYFRLIARRNTDNQSNQIIKSAYSFVRNRPITFAGLTDLLISFPPLLKADDRISTTHGIENRSPFLDHRIIEFAMSLPDNLKINTNIKQQENFFNTKFILKKAVKDIVPDIIINRFDKVGYPSPVAQWLHNDFNKLIIKLQNKKNIPLDIKDLLHNEENNSRGDYDRTRWQFLQFSIWYMIFIEQQSTNSIVTFLKKYV